MAYFWVNQGSSSVAERAGGFFWAPNQTSPVFKHHTNVGLFRPGDIIICKGFADIDYVAIVKSAAVNNHPVPASHIGGWAGNGYFAVAEYVPAPCPRTASHLYANTLIHAALASAIPKLITVSGSTSQTYACSISDQAGLALLYELGFNAATGISAPRLDANGVVVVPATSADALVKVRIGQDKFRKALLSACGGACAVLQIAFPAVLRASHIKPWAASNDVERLDPDNGIALSGHLDLLFDQGFISFDAAGCMLISSQLPLMVATALGINRAGPAPALSLNPRLLSGARMAYLKYHRDHRFVL
ncbi:MAG: HNH endonuclease [Pseudomonadota bacterium]